jgi:hypothetical protein
MKKLIIKKIGLILLYCGTSAFAKINPIDNNNSKVK